MDKNHKSRPHKEAQIIGRIFRQKATFLIEELGQTFKLERLFSHHLAPFIWLFVREN